MRYFNWKTAIVSVVIFVLPMLFYPVMGTMANGITTYSYGFPSTWLTVQLETPGGRLFGFELFGADIVQTNVSVLTAVLDLLVIYFVVTAFVRVFWINHFSIKLANRRANRRMAQDAVLEHTVVMTRVSSEEGDAAKPQGREIAETEPDRTA